MTTKTTKTTIAETYFTDKFENEVKQAKDWKVMDIQSFSKLNKDEALHIIYLISIGYFPTEELQRKSIKQMIKEEYPDKI